VQFLYLANNGTDPAQGGNAFLGEEGLNLLDAWLNTGMAEPYVMASASWGSSTPVCTASVPALLSASPADKSVDVSWEAVADTGLSGYRLYYDQGGKAQLVTDIACTVSDQAGCTSYSDTGLTNGQQYCYKVTSYSSDCESGFSSILCATPTPPGQAAEVAVSDPLVTGKWVTEGKGNNATTSFVATAEFVAGDEVVIRATVVDGSGSAVPDATVTLSLSGPESTELVTSPSDAEGVAVASWATKSANRKGAGGTAAGTYTATITGVSVNGYAWDGVRVEVSFTVSP
jgi:hypothetical protein